MLWYDSRHSCLSPQRRSLVLPLIYVCMICLKNNDRIDLTVEFLRNARISIPVPCIVFPLYFFNVKPMQSITETRI